MPDQGDGAAEVGGDGGRAGPERRALFELAVVDRSATELYAEAAGAGRHHRAGIRAVPARRLGAPAGQGLAGMAEQGVGQGREAGRQPVQRIVDAGSRAADQVETFAAVAPHGVQRVGQPEEQGAGAAEQGEPEQGAEDGVVAVFEHRFHAGLGNARFVEGRGVA